MEKIEVTPEQLGQILFVFILDIALDNLKNKEIIETLGIEKKEQSNLLREMIIINMFAVITAIQDLLKNEKTENDILDYMHKAYFKALIKELNFGEEEITAENTHILTRYKEYQEAMQEKRGPNWLWPLTDHMLNNLRGEKTKDAISMMCLTTIISKLMEILPETINKYAVGEN